MKPVVTEALGLLVLLERRDPKVRRDQREIRAMWAKLGKQGLLVKQDLQVLTDLLARQAHLATTAKPDPPEKQETLEELVRRGRLDLAE